MDFPAPAFRDTATRDTASFQERANGSRTTASSLASQAAGLRGQQEARDPLQVQLVQQMEEQRRDTLARQAKAAAAKSPWPNAQPRPAGVFLPVVDKFDRADEEKRSVATESEAEGYAPANEATDEKSALRLKANPAGGKKHASRWFKGRK